MTARTPSLIKRLATYQEPPGQTQAEGYGTLMAARALRLGMTGAVAISLAFGIYVSMEHSSKPAARQLAPLSPK